MRYVAVFLVFVLCLVTVAADDFSVFIHPSEQVMYEGGSASFSFDLSSNLPREQTFDVVSQDFNWDVELGHPLIVPPGGNISTEMTVTPVNVNLGRFTLPLSVRPIGGGNTLRKIVRLEVREESEKPNASYVPAVRGTVHMPPEIDPRQPVEVEIVLKNQNKKVLDDVSVRLRSDVVSDDVETSLDPLQERSLSYAVDIDPRTPPQNDVLNAVVIVETDKAYRFDLLPTPFKVIGYGEIVENVSETSGFLTRSVSIYLKNEGNSPRLHTVNLPVGWNRLFMRSSLPAERVDGKVKWSLDMEPGEDVEIVVTFNYQPLFFLLLVALVAVFIYYYARSPLVVRKRATVLSGEEGVNELKVFVEIRNRSSKIARHVHVMDLVPSVASVHGAKGQMLQPTKIVPAGHRGTLVKWVIDRIEPKEQRILAYTAKCQFTVLGGLTFPVAAVKFMVDHRHRKASSNRPVVSIQ